MLIMPTVVMLSVIYVECHNLVLYAECRNVVMLNVVMLNVAMLNVNMLMVLAPAAGLTRKYQTRHKILAKDILSRIFVYFVNEN
jgi:hypothetical protein